MTAIRSVRAAEGKFVQIANSAAQDRRLSGLARAIILLVLSMPPEQHLTATWLDGQFPDGRRPIRSALDELETYGYYRKTRTSGGRGVWKWEQVISDAPIATESDNQGAQAEFPQVVSSDQSTSDENTSDVKRSDKRSNTEDPKDVGPADLASRRAHAKRTGKQRTVRDAIDGVRAAVTAVHGQHEAGELSDEDALGLYFTYVGRRSPGDIVSYLSKIFSDAPYLDSFLSNSEPACLRCQHHGSNCQCPAA